MPSLTDSDRSRADYWLGMDRRLSRWATDDKNLMWLANLAWELFDANADIHSADEHRPDVVGVSRLRERDGCGAGAR
jgi:hypothetical protein